MRAIQKKRLTVVALAIACSAVLMAFFLYTGTILFNNPSREKYPVRGVDVSHHQGDINWKLLSQQDITFAYIKATEGSSFVDKNFMKNFSGASETALRVGAYHFFSYDSSGEAQYANFISVVPLRENMLPPVIDIEFYGDKEENLPDREKTKTELKILLQLLEKQYQMKPIIYTTGKVYNLYLIDDFYENDIWIRNILTEPRLADGCPWKFWQYTAREKLAGYDGREKYIDMNAFAGTPQEFAVYPARLVAP